MPPVASVADSAPVRARRHFSTPSQRVGLQVSCWFLVVSVLAMAIGVTAPAGEGGGGQPGWVAVPFVLIALVDLVFTYTRLRPAGAWIQDDGVRIVNPFSTTFVPWGRVFRFALKPGGQFGGDDLVCFVEILGGGDVRVWGIQQPRAVWWDGKVDRTQPLVDELNAIAAEHARAATGVSRARSGVRPDSL